MSEWEERRLEDLNIKPGLKLRFFSPRLEEAEIETKEDCGQACPVWLHLNSSKVDASKVKLSKVNLSEVKLSKDNLSKVDVSEVHVFKVKLS